MHAEQGIAWSLRRKPSSARPGGGDARPTVRTTLSVRGAGGQQGRRGRAERCLDALFVSSRRSRPERSATAGSRACSCRGWPTARRWPATRGQRLGPSESRTPFEWRGRRKERREAGVRPAAGQQIQQGAAGRSERRWRRLVGRAASSKREGGIAKACLLGWNVSIMGQL